MTEFSKKKILIISSQQPHNQYAGGESGIHDSEQKWMRLLGEELYDALKATGHDVRLGPKGDANTDYSDNVNWVNKSENCDAALEISLHSNATGQSGTKATGIGCYHHPNSSKGKDFAVSAVPFLKPVSAANKAYTGTLTVAELASTKPPAVLFENEYHDWEGSTTDGGSKWIRDNANRTALVGGYKKWIIDMWGTKESTTDPATEDTDIKVASYNPQAKQWGGGSYGDDIEFMLDELGASIYFGQEMEEGFRNQFKDEAGGHWKSWANGYTVLFWDGDKYSYSGDIEVDFDTSYHALIGKELTRKSKKAAFASVHIKPNDAYPDGWTDEEKRAAKLKDVQRVCDELADYDHVIVGGDWNTSHHKDVMEDNGYTLVTPWEATTDKGDKLDAIWIRGSKVKDRTGGSIVKTPTSDHHALVANLTLLGDS